MRESPLDVPPPPPDRKTAKAPAFLIAWRTDAELNIISVTRKSPGDLRCIPIAGNSIRSEHRRIGYLDSAAHLQALSGRRVLYHFTLFGRTYEVALVPRRNRRSKLIGVSGRLRQVSQPAKKPAAPRPAPPSPKAGPWERLARRRGRNSVRAAIRSLELAKAVADTARVSAEIRHERAISLQKKAFEAQIRAEEEERRARVLADASAILDSSFDQQQTLSRLGRLIVLRMADWLVLHFRVKGRLKRTLVIHREASQTPLLEQAFPADEPEPPQERQDRGDVSPWGLHASVTPATIERLIPRGSRRQAFRGLGAQSMIQTPVTAHGRAIGILTLASSDPGRLFNVQDLLLAKDLAARIALARESSRLYDEAQRELTLRREAEAQLRGFNVDLERRVMERTALFEEATREANNFAYTVAHDLRAPLRAITGFCQALKEDYSGTLDPAGKDYLDRIVSGARRMDDLIRDLLDYARLNRAEIRKGVVDLDRMVDSALQLMASDLSQRGAEICVERPLGRVVGQEVVLGQAISNLLSNAIKFVASGVKPAVRVFSQRHGRSTRIVVGDNGIGIAREHHDRIFGIFERLNRAEEYPGTGIGLAIVRRSVERLGGSVGVDSEPGKGSRFWIELPSAEFPPPAPFPALSSRGSPRSPRGSSGKPE